ncbi:hypothetical protein JCM10212_003496 [Sporobolomyces blumeae]
MPLALGVSPPLPPRSLSSSISTSSSPPNESAADRLSDDLATWERYRVREIMEGFPVHRDSCEWDKLRALFAEDDAYVFTTWSGGVPIDEFIKISQTGFAKGVQIAHRVNGSTVDVAISGPRKGQRALGKLKATITQRFEMPCVDGNGKCEVDIDADCRLCFFLEKDQNGGWKTHFFKGIYERDRPHAIDPGRLPVFDREKLESFPKGYRHLGYCQEEISGYKVKRDLPQSRGQEHDEFYECFLDWLRGVEIDEMKVKLGV